MNHNHSDPMSAKATEFEFPWLKLFILALIGLLTVVGVHAHTEALIGSRLRAVVLAAVGIVAGLSGGVVASMIGFGYAILKGIRK